jgi:hypothetical protein
MGWVNAIMSKTQKIPHGRVRTSHVDIRNIDALKAKGYKKGDPKRLTGNYELVRRTTDPQTVSVTNALHRDDVVDIEEIAKTIKGAKAYYLQNFRDADSVIEEGMHSVSHDTLLKMKEAAEKYLDHVEIRGE